MLAAPATVRCASPGTLEILRIGDHCTNIAENVYYVVHGRPLAGERPKGDQTSTMAVDFKPQ